MNQFPRKFVKEFKRKAIAALKNKEKWEKESHGVYVYKLDNLWCCAKVEEGGHLVTLSIGKNYPYKGSFLEFQFFYLGIVYFKIQKMIKLVNLRDFYADLLHSKDAKKETLITGISNAKTLSISDPAISTVRFGTPLVGSPTMEVAGDIHAKTLHVEKIVKGKRKE